MAAAPAVIPQSHDPAKCPRTMASGKQCGNRAGKGTDHVGYGFCDRHGGSSPNLRTHAAKLMAMAEMPIGGGEMDVNPLDALLYTVRRASGLAAWHRLQAEAALAAGDDAAIYLTLERQASDDLAKRAKMAIDAGVAERMVRIAENTGERIASAFEDGIDAMVAAGLEVSPQQRREAVAAFAGALSRLEREQPAIPAKATDV